MSTRILSSLILSFFALSIYAQGIVDQSAYWKSALRNNNSSQWDTLSGCAECHDISLSGTVSDTFGTRESNRHKGGSDCDMTFNVKLDAGSKSRLEALQKKYGIKTTLMPELHVEVICANKTKTCDVCNSISAIPPASLPKVHDQVTVTGRLIIDRGKEEDADKDKRLPEFEIHPAFSIVKK